MKKILSALLAAAMCLSLAACSSKPAESGAASSAPGAESDLAYVKDKGQLVIGYTVYEPMNYTDENGVFTGFDTELATKVCEELGVEPVFQKIDWQTKEVELAGKSIDCIWNGMTLDAEREANMNCTKPYVKNAQVVGVKKGTEYTDTASLIGKTIVAEAGSAGELQILGNDETQPDANLAQADYVAKGVQTDCLMEVKAGTAVAAILDMTLANAMVGEGTDYEDLVIVDQLAVENYGVAFRKGSDIRDEVNKIFDALIADGFLAALADKYNLELAE